MKRTNQFVVRPRSEQDRELLHELLDASASLWNELTYERRQQYFDGESIWDTADYRKQYVGVLGSATAQQLIRKSKSAWKSFFSLKEDGEKCSPPGYWGNEDDGRTLRTYVRNDQYTLEMGERSRLEIPVGKELKEKYDLGYQERLPPLADETAALDIGANNIVACTTTTGEQYLYEGRDLFERFRETTREIARLQSKLREGRYSSNRIRRLYRRRTRRRDHAMDALARGLIERLYDEGISTVYVGDLTDVLETHWSVQANAKTHNFWAFR
ncbi:transposase, partial [Natronobiforma cellulositropha]|uniref:transposase n=1 Tax=Natronobiforma cellulositropha TaxID=1679076 RepID=UPI0021D5ADD5